jgi:hypothetical protein
MDMIAIVEPTSPSSVVPAPHSPELFAPEQTVADVELEQRVIEFFQSRNVPGLRGVHVQAKAGTVTITGKVLTFYEKQLCNQCCRVVPGVVQLINAVDVCGVTHSNT